MDWVTLISSLIIVGFFLVIVILLSKNYIELSQKEKEIQEKVNRVNLDLSNDENLSICGKVDTDASVTPYTVRTCEKEFNKLCLKHDTLAQYIPLFPMMGILGTVIGLIQQVGAKEIDKMLSSLGTALVTTLLGLVFAIILKLADIKLMKVINNAEIELDYYDRKLELIEMNEKKQNAQAGRKNK